MTNDRSTIIHINVTNFAAAVAIAKQPALAERPFVIAKSQAERKVVLSMSHQALLEGITVGMPVAVALRLVPSLVIIPPDSLSGAQIESAMHTIASRFSPTVQQDGGGHLYVDVSGTSRLFGPPIDCAVRMRNEIQRSLGMKPAVAVATNRLVAKIGTRTIRPCGITQIRAGDEASFLQKQDITLLPGVGPAISRILSVAGFCEIGELADLDDFQVTALLGRRGTILRDAARGWDDTQVEPSTNASRSIRRRIDFAEPIGDTASLRSAMITTAEDAGLAMRRELLTCKNFRCTIHWADGSATEGSWTAKEPMLFDTQIIDGSWRAMERALHRRVRIRSMTMVLGTLVPVHREPDLFPPEPNTVRQERLQSAVDATRLRFGPTALTRAAAVTHVQ